MTYIPSVSMFAVMKIEKYYPVLATNDVPRASDFYKRHLGFVEGYVTDWFVFLLHPASDGFALGLVQRDHETMPGQARQVAAGVLLSLEVPDVDAAHARLVEAGASIAVPPRDEPWGQRHFLVDAPDGVLLDVITPIPPSEEYAHAYSDAS